MAITHLHRRGTVMLRYIIGDVVTLSLDPCPTSGRIGERVVTTPRRTGNLVKCRGMLVNTDIVLDYLDAIKGVGDVQIEFARKDKPGAMDAMILRLEFGGDDLLRDQISSDIRSAVSMRPDVRFVDRGTLYDQRKSIKLRRIIDSRAPVD